MATPAVAALPIALSTLSSWLLFWRHGVLQLGASRDFQRQLWHELKIPHSNLKRSASVTCRGAFRLGARRAKEIIA
ncbi:hypothetical protein B0H14DRAFT_3029861 [Mycena olivaceomarginata]|nr:hypothetical protein B0H14DRAFT_3029861 [Mycena olivaceomarginata]